MEIRIQKAIKDRKVIQFLVIGEKVTVEPFVLGYEKESNENGTSRI